VPANRPGAHLQVCSICLAAPGLRLHAMLGQHGARVVPRAVLRGQCCGLCVPAGCLAGAHAVQCPAGSWAAYQSLQLPYRQPSHS
jgi:hypothetical protein